MPNRVQDLNKTQRLLTQQTKYHSLYQEQEHHNLKEKRQSTDANTEMNETIEFSERDLKAAFLALVAAIIDDSGLHQTLRAALLPTAVAE